MSKKKMRVFSNCWPFNRLALILVIVINPLCLSYADEPLNWSVSEIYGEMFYSQSEAEQALRSLGGKYAYSDRVETEEFSVVNSIPINKYYYSSILYEPLIGPWYDYKIQWAQSNPHPSEEEALLSVEAKVNADTCGLVSLIENTEWYPYKTWYSGDAYEESKFYNLQYDALPCVEPMILDCKR